MTTSDGVVGRLLAEILRDAHRYVPGLEQRHPTAIARSRSERLLVLGRERLRDLVERGAARARFTHQHFDPEVAAARLSRILELSPGLEAAYADLGDDYSRRALLDVLKLRVLGPYHAPLRITPDGYRERQSYADRSLRCAQATFDVSDPYFSPLSLYRAPVNNGDTVSLHSHSVDLVSVFLLEQYSYGHGLHRVRAEPGDVVIDAGGCWGDTALYFASLVGPHGKVFTFEFDPESLEILHANLALNPELAERIEVVSLALWNRSGETLEFTPAGRMTTVGRPSEDGASELRVSTVTLDDYVKQQGLDRVDYIKMDVEGAELAVIDGAGETVKRLAPKFGIAAYHRDDDLVRIPEALRSFDSRYRFYIDSFSPAEDETVVFARVPSDTAVSRRT